VLASSLNLFHTYFMLVAAVCQVANHTVTSNFNFNVIFITELPARLHRVTIAVAITLFHFMSLTVVVIWCHYRQTSIFLCLSLKD